MEWLPLKAISDWQQVLQLSESSVVIVFKHSSRCSLSSIARQRIDDYSWPDSTHIWWVDVVIHRELSRLIAAAIQVHHESPQVLLIHLGECFWDEDHLDIDPEEMHAALLARYAMVS